MLNHCTKTVPLAEEGLARPVALAANDLAVILRTVEVYNPSGRFISVSGSLRALVPANQDTESVRRAGSRHCHLPKCHLATAHKCSGIALWRKVLAHRHLAAATCCLRDLSAAFHASIPQVALTWAAATSHESSHQEAPLGEKVFLDSKVDWLASLMSCERWWVACSTSLGVDRARGGHGHSSRN